VEGRKPLIVVVDIDNDVESVLGRRVIIGYDEVRRAALEYGEKRPEDADLNAMFAGLELYKRFRREGRDPEIVVVGGHEVDSLEAQRRIKESIREVVSRIGEPVEFYIVSDGEDEMAVAEVLHDLGEIGGFRRVVVEQHLGIEGNYLLLFKYLKKAVQDPKYARYFVGVPGIALFLIALLAILDIAYLALEVLAVIIGIMMFIRGFNLEEPLENWIRSIIAGIRESPHFNIAGILTLLVFAGAGLYAGYTVYTEAREFSTLVIGEIMRTTIPLIGAGIVSYVLITRLFSKASKGDINLLRDVEIMIVVAAVSLGFFNLGTYIKAHFAGETPTTIPLTAFTESGFIQYVIIGTGLAALIEVFRRLYLPEDREEEAVTVQNS